LKGREFFRVGQAGEIEGRWQDDRCRNDRASERTPPRFIYTGDGSVAALARENFEIKGSAWGGVGEGELHGQETPLHFQLDFRKCLRYNLSAFANTSFKVKERTSYDWTIFWNRFFGLPLFAGRLEELAHSVGTGRVGNGLSVSPPHRADCSSLYVKP
jgi:hypothetical protein